MIIDFSVSNYKFITERQTISLEALTGKRDKQSKDNIVNAKYRIAGYGILGGKTKNIKLLKDVYVFGKKEAMQNLKGAIELFNKIINVDKVNKYEYKYLSKNNNGDIEFEITFLLDNIRYIYKLHYDIDHFRHLLKYRNWFECTTRELVYYPKGKKNHTITNKVFMKALDYLSNNRLDQIIFSNDTSLMNKVRKDQIYLADINYGSNTEIYNTEIYPITDYYNSRKEDIENEYLCGRLGAIPRNNLKEY